jgi:hypothetical protein
MKKLIQILTTAVISTAFMGSMAGAQAVSPCDSFIITNTGPHSNNGVDCFVNKNITLKCNNNIYTLNENDQVAKSGDADVSHNTTSGVAYSGDASNESSVLTNIDVSCAAAIVADTGGGGGGATEAPGGGEGAINELPNTANTPAIFTLISTAAIATGLVFATRFAYVASRYLIKK